MDRLTFLPSTIEKVGTEFVNPTGDWDILKSHCDLYHNPLLRFDVPTYSVHVDAGAHTTFYSAALSGDLFSSAQRTLHTPR